MKAVKMRKVLVISSVIPISSIKHKRDENDILLTTEDELLKRYRDLEFRYVFVHPRSNRIFALLSQKWNSYFQTQKTKALIIKGKLVHPIGIYAVKRKKLNTFLFKISTVLIRKKIERLIKTFQPTIIHAHNVEMDLELAYWIHNRYGIPYIVTTREIANKPNSSRTNKLLKSASKIISLNRIQKDIASRMSGFKNVEVITHGIDDKFFNYATKTRNNTIRFLSVCRLLKLKNLDLVIKSLHKVGGDFEYNIYGTGPEEDKLKELVRSLELEDKIKFWGYIDNDLLPSVYWNHDLFLMPSYPEAFGRVYLEAMASGTPVVASKNTGVDGIILNGVNGFLVDHLNETEIQLLLNKIIKKQLSLSHFDKEARDTAERFNWNNICLKLNEI